jgi:hypothetical protein
MRSRAGSRRRSTVRKQAAMELQLLQVLTQIRDTMNEAPRGTGYYPRKNDPGGGTHLPAVYFRWVKKFFCAAVLLVWWASARVIKDYVVNLGQILQRPWMHADIPSGQPARTEWITATASPSPIIAIRIPCHNEEVTIPEVISNFKLLSFFGGFGILMFLMGIAAGLPPVIGYIESGHTRVARFPLAILAIGPVLLSSTQVQIGIILHSVNWRSKELHNVLVRDRQWFKMP